MNRRNRGKAQSKRQSVRLLDEVLERRMLLYALAAGAALTGASVAQAKVVFTPSNVVVQRPHSLLEIDLNNDGVTDFALFDYIYSFSNTYLLDMVGRRASNTVELAPPGGGGFAAALKRGNPIGSGGVFNRDGRMAELGGLSEYPGGGHFLNTTNRFLGVKFLINGEVHFGWIGFRSVTRNFTATLGGWAYETEPNTPIIAGDKGDADSDSTALQAGPTSLELLAAGHVAIAERRRRIAA